MPAEEIGKMMAIRAVGTVVVVTGGDHPAAADVPRLPGDALVIGADSGIDRALELGLHVDVAVGDFDSVSAQGLRAVTQAGAVLERHPTAKDATDLRLALDMALAYSPDRIIVLGGDGGRLDHLMGNILLLGADDLAGVEIVAHMGSARVTVVRARADLHGARGDIVSLLPLQGTAVGVTTEGLLYPLRAEDLIPATTRGVSNELTAAIASVTVRDGVLLAVQPVPTRTRQTRNDP